MGSEEGGMSDFQRVRYKDKDGNHQRVVFLRVTKDSERFLTGVEVDRTGKDIAPSSVLVIDKSLIVWRRFYSMDSRHGDNELVPGRAALPSSAPSWTCPTHGFNGLDRPKRGRECNCRHRQER